MKLRLLPFYILVASILPRLLYAQTTQSVLSDGTIFKFAVEQYGVYKLDYTFFEQLGINPTTIEPDLISIYGQGGGFLPEANDEERPDDLSEVAIQVSGGGDGSFDPSDYILFYGEGIDQREFVQDENRFHQEKNPYDTRNYYFIKLRTDQGARVADIESVANAEYETNAYSDFQRIEDEYINLLHYANDANLQGSGRKWLGDEFERERSREYTSRFDFRGLITSEPISVNLEFAGRGSETTTLLLHIGGNELSTPISRSDVTNIERPYAKTGVIREETLVQTNDPEIVLEYPRLASNNRGWLDFLELNFRRDLVYRNQQLRITDIRAYDYNSSTYQLKGGNENVILWDISDPFNPLNVQYQLNGDQIQFGVSHQDEPTIVAFDLNNTLQAEPVGEVQNQNLHGIDDVEYLIVYHPDFMAAAEKLAQHRSTHSNLRVATVSTDQVFHEFSSGKTDPTAIRDFARRLYLNSEGFRYLLLLGDGSFDYRHIYSDLNNESFVPVYETAESYHPITAYPSDDYFALLDDHEGGTIRGALDIAVGRFPVRTLDEANIIVQKIIDYETGEKTLGDWRVNLLFVADDEDGNRHLDTADGIAEKVREEQPLFNINKVYLDAYEQENTPGGVFNFKATEALNNQMFQGQLVVNYLGHGGSNGWAQERVLRHQDIDKWNNLERLPLLITATCSFAGYDNPAKITAGEYTLTNATGGSVALFTTVRAVYANSNERLTEAVFDKLFENVGEEHLSIGEILINAKNSNSQDTSSSNARKFTLLGDPALKLAIPKYFTHTTRINGTDIRSAVIDTLKALSKVEIEGEVHTRDGQLATNFNGNIYPTIFDKAVTLKTLAQDQGSAEQEFILQKSVIFKGLASVANGKFKFSFVVPKDINYAFGQGKISYYAEDGTPLDAGGAFEEIIVGGTNPEGLVDDTGPEIEIFMDNEDFMFGDMTGKNPSLLLKLSDDNGINVIGNSIGHDLTAVLDNNFQNTILLNEFYESEKDNHTKGQVNYPLDNLELGKHTLSVKAWDIANNSSEAFTEFVVVDDAAGGLRHVLNYPNPFSDNTCFQFEHQFQNQMIDIRVDILTPSGQMVTSLEKTINASGTLSRDVKWDGRDDFGDPLANGIYIYRVTVRPTEALGTELKTSSELQKLVIVR